MASRMKQGALARSIGGTGRNDVLRGGAEDDVLNGGVGNDRLLGFAGEDRLVGGVGNDLLDGGDDADRMIGGKGNDTYIVDDMIDRITEARNQGTDVVRTEVNYTLPPNTEKLVVVGGIHLTIIGNILGNTLRGNDTRNVLNGMRGRDVLTGGGDEDQFDFDHMGPLHFDRVTDFVSGEDVLRLNPSRFTALTGSFDDVLSSEEFRLSSQPADGNDFVVYNRTTGLLAYDASGGGGQLQAIARLDPGTRLVADDILVGFTSS